MASQPPIFAEGSAVVAVDAAFIGDYIRLERGRGAWRLR